MLGICIACSCANSRTRRCRQPFTLKKHGSAVRPGPAPTFPYHCKQQVRKWCLRFRLAQFPSRIDPPMPTYAQLKKQIEQLSKKAEAAMRAEKDAVLAKVKDAIRSFDLTVEEVFGGSAKGTSKNAKSAPAKRVPKGAGQAKYSDPKTGATWSGFGRAPAWIASAKDRTKFLVDKQSSPATRTKLDSGKPKAATKSPKAAKTAVKAVAATAPSKKVARSVTTATAKKATKPASTTKAVAAAKKPASVAPTKTAGKAAAPANKVSRPKSKKQVAPAQAPASVVAPTDKSVT